MLAVSLVAQPGKDTQLPLQSLTKVSQVRSLGQERASKPYPVHLTGVVTVPSTYKTSFFFMDSTAGISVDRGDAGGAMEAGERVVIDGESAPGLFAPVVIARHITVLGKSTLPAPHELEAEALRGGQQDSQWISLRGQVRSASIRTVWGHPVLLLNMDIGTTPLMTVQVRDYAKGGWNQLAGAVVQIRGVCATAFNDRRQFMGLRMIVSSLDDISVVKPAIANPFDLPTRPMGQLFQFNEPTQISERVKVTGTVTEYQSGQNMFLQDGKWGLFVKTSHETPVTPGTRVEVVGYPVAGEYTPVLEDAIYRVMPGKDAVSAVPITAAQAMQQSERGFWTAPYEALTVQMDAEVMVHAQDDTRDQIFLREGNTIFRARFPTNGAGLPALEPGTMVRVTGICIAHIDEEHNIHNFSLLLRSPGDVVVMHRVAWWRRKEAGWTVALALAFAFLIVAIVALLKRQADLRTLAMRDSLTGAYNRRAFLRLADRAWRGVSRSKPSAMLVYLDVDRFKEINDHFGHEAGDQALRCVVEALRLSFRQNDIIGRIGGDEFAIFCLCGEEQFAPIVARLKRTLEDLSKRGGLAFGIDLSIGLLACDESMAGATVEDLLPRADLNMYQAKSARKRVQETALGMTQTALHS